MKEKMGEWVQTVQFILTGMNMFKNIFRPDEDFSGEATSVVQRHPLYLELVRSLGHLEVLSTVNDDTVQFTSQGCPNLNHL